MIKTFTSYSLSSDEMKKGKCNPNHKTLKEEKGLEGKTRNANSWQCKTRTYIRRMPRVRPLFLHRKKYHP